MIPKLLVLLIALAYATKVEFCPSLNPTEDFDEEAVLGIWYIHEYIFHRENISRTEYNPYCPVIQIRKFEDYVNGGLINRDLVSAFVVYFYIGRSHLWSAILTFFDFIIILCDFLYTF